ncbi:hypothetical protein EDD37DRAFT_647414 [Exophiala viscosa]|uniref:Tachykinin family protein n=1 Tax=Exophiala viscosa TaxID=2486360 RepID=A0AAN6IIF6_9EURO|nr:hypothetical protein EDD36DRAFT_460260 [Exophiala viscosa]KAI1627755.1 hypothetical protein EDD37DRAFT_647414 [Exophiala viscosa]
MRNAQEKVPAESANNSNLTSSNAPEATKYTFVDQTGDLFALTHRRISNRQQRHVIRSHVMQRVRHLELAQGNKRTPGRDTPRRSSSDKSQKGSNVSDSPIKDEPVTPTIPGVVRIQPKQNSTALLPLDSVRTSATGRSRPGISLSPSPSSNHEFDPFHTLPSSNVPHQSSESLLGYCFDIMLPLTFAVEYKRPSERLARQAMVLHSKMNSPATFLGFMATVAAHRAILYGRHEDLSPSPQNHDELITDPDYKKVKHEAIVAVRRSIDRQEPPSQYMVDACFGLISTAAVVGNFEEATIHLRGIADIMSRVGASPESMLWLPITNVKISVAMLSKPILQLPWQREPIPADIQQRIAPEPDSEMARMGLKFQQLEELSDSLQALLLTGRDICNLCQINAENSRGLSPWENAILRQKATEFEFDLVAYPYESPAFPRERNGEPLIPPLERVVRLAALGLMQFAPHTILPATGVGRALTQHQKRATEAWLYAKQGQCEVTELRAITWSLFVFVQRATKQPEAEYFMNLLDLISANLLPLTWPEVEKMLNGFLYIPMLHAAVWQGIWLEVTVRSRAMNRSPLNIDRRGEMQQHLQHQL